MNTLLARLISSLTGAREASAQLEELSNLLSLSPEELKTLPANPRLSYRSSTIRKRGGGERKISAPSGQLKSLQRRLLHNYLAHQPTHEAATAFRAGSSIAVHARRHLGQAMVLTVDLTDFFPSTSARRVREWFRGLGWQDEALRVLMRLCVYQGGLPQGAPTSPALSNLVNVPLDQELSELAAWHGGRYSRYCDDLAFSWGANAEPAAFRPQVEDILRRCGYAVQARKGWRLQRASERPEVTGVVLAGRRLRLPERVLLRLRRLQARWRTDAATEAQIQGYLGLKKMLK